MWRFEENGEEVYFIVVEYCSLIMLELFFKVIIIGDVIVGKISFV